MKTSRCRSCGAEIYWLPNDQTGKKAPIDVMPSHDGAVVLMLDPNDLWEPVAYHVLTTDERERRRTEVRVPPKSSASRYSNHFQTCPHAKSWKKGSR